MLSAAFSHIYSIQCIVQHVKPRHILFYCVFYFTNITFKYILCINIYWRNNELNSQILTNKYNTPKAQIPANNGNELSQQITTNNSGEPNHQFPHKQERRTQPPIPHKQQRRTQPPIPHKQQRRTKPPIPHIQQRRTKPPPQTKWNVKSNKSNQTNIKAHKQRVRTQM